MFIRFWVNEELQEQNSIKINKTHVECTGATVGEKDKFLIDTYLKEEENSKDVNNFDSEIDNDDETGSLPSINSWGD